MRKTIPTAILIGAALLPSVAAADTPASCPTVSERGGYIYDPCQGTLTYPPTNGPRWAVNFGPAMSGPANLVAGPLYLSPKGGTIALGPGTACSGQADVRTTKRPIGASGGKHLWGKRWAIPGCGPCRRSRRHRGPRGRTRRRLLAPRRPGCPPEHPHTDRTRLTCTTTSRHHGRRH